MSKSLTISKSYNNLILSIKKTLSSGLVEAKKALEYQRLKTYWQVGKTISDFTSDGELILNEELYQKMSSDLNKQTGLDLSNNILKRSVQLNRNYLQFPKDTTLTFTHYIVLQRIKDLRLRSKIEKDAIKKDLTVNEIRAVIAQIDIDKKCPNEKSTRRLECERGEPFVYRVLERTDVTKNKVFYIDCGFKINISLDSNVFGKKIISSCRNSNVRIVAVTKKEDCYEIITDKEGYSKLYTYLARVIKVIDGDTIDVRIDVGFGVGLSDRLRLKKINTAETTTYSGKYAKQFLTDYLSKCPFIIIRTQKEGMFGRWLADVFTLPNCKDPYKIAAEGEYLNQLLLDKGLAEVY
ncbi:MAG: hypothetical protein P9X22_08525 [Candidatus Zapsychrus exili]|nr:hypothetical protein [Candidatus Zapsychrus exili]